ncbi:MAG: D-alanine--D-alanine ligase family protein [Pseudomonadota bacterium]
METLKTTAKRKIRVAVLYGGRSSEHEVSLQSATNVIQNLDRSRFEIVPIGIDKQGSWFLGHDPFPQLGESGELQLSADDERRLFTPDLIGKQPAIARSLTSHAHSADRIFDVVFPVIHGPHCEDGTVQGLLELADVPYVGSGVLASSVGMDKDVSKRLIKASGLNIPPFLSIKQGHWMQDPDSFCREVRAQLKLPLFVKPANTGSSVGVQKIKDYAALNTAIDTAFTYDTKVIVEQGIDAMEIEIAVLESLHYGHDPIISVPGEIRPQNGHEFYSYESKYLDANGYALFIPAPVAEPIQEKLKQVAKAIFALLDCEGMARVDLFLEKGTDQIYFNEINTIPGFTQISMYPKLMVASGMEYKDLLSHLIDLAIDRHSRKSLLCREYVPE